MAAAQAEVAQASGSRPFRPASRRSCSEPRWRRTPCASSCRSSRLPACAQRLKRDVQAKAAKEAAEEAQEAAAAERASLEAAAKAAKEQLQRGEWHH